MERTYINISIFTKGQVVRGRFLVSVSEVLSRELSGDNRFWSTVRSEASLPESPTRLPPEPPRTSPSLSEHPRASATRCPGGSTARRPGMPREQKAENSPPKLGELGSPLNRRAPGAHLHALPQVNHADPRRQDDLHSAAVFPSQAT